MKTSRGQYFRLAILTLILAIQACAGHESTDEPDDKSVDGGTPTTDSVAAPAPDTAMVPAPRVAAIDPVTLRLPTPPPTVPPPPPATVLNEDPSPMAEADNGGASGPYASVRTGNNNQPRVYLPSEVDVQPVYPDGQAAFSRYIYEHFVMPEPCKDIDINRFAKVRFVVEANGSISNVEALEGPAACPEFAKEAVHVVTTAPNWIPAKIGSAQVRCAVILPVRLITE